MSTIRLLLVDDHEIVRSGLKAFLSGFPDLEVVGEAGSGEAALSLAAQCQPDVALMDVSMAGIDGMETTRRLHAARPQTAVLALTVHSSKEFLFEMLNAGVSGYVTKQAATEELVAAIRAVARGEVYVQPAMARLLLADYLRLANITPAAPESAAPSTDPGLAALSGRERQVLERVAQGHSNQEIGEALGISPRTVGRHRERIMHKLNLHSRGDLIKFALRTGLITLE
ncbi:MAG: response regulator transcription factor [Chloroflexi bacterium]|nr:response regulator transcription factor [Chloroflexota bacterium]